MGGIDHYTLEDNITLRNKFGITDYKTLLQVEGKLTSERIFELKNNPVKGNYDFDHLKKIHGYIFQDIYEWAGKPRNLGIGKGGTWFCHPQHIDSYAQHIFSKIKENNYLKGLEEDKFAEKAAYVISELNELHPFREGNGRTQREFMRELAEQAGYKLDLNRVPKEQMILASREAHDGNYKDFQMMIKQHAVPIKDLKLNISKGIGR